MNRRVAGIGLLLFAAGLFFLWPSESPPKMVSSPPVVKPFPKKKVVRQAPEPPPVHRAPPPREKTVERTELIVDVVDEDGRPDDRARVWITGCKVLGGRQRAFVVEPGHCEVHGARRDGALFARAEPVQVDVAAGDSGYAQVQLPSTKTGGLGISIRMDHGAIRVLSVMPGTPAEKMGLVPGDRIVEVDGVPTTELGVRGFVQRMTGPVGTEVEFVLRYEEEGEVVEEPLTIVRSFLKS